MWEWDWERLVSGFEVRQKCRRGVRSISAKLGHLQDWKASLSNCANCAQVMMIMITRKRDRRADHWSVIRERSSNLSEFKTKLLALLSRNCNLAIFGKKALLSSGIFSTPGKRGISFLKMQIKRPLAPQFASKSGNSFGGEFWGNRRRLFQWCFEILVNLRFGFDWSQRQNKEEW